MRESPVLIAYFNVLVVFSVLNAAVEKGWCVVTVCHCAKQITLRGDFAVL